MALKLVETGLFATVQFPFNFIEDAARTGSTPRRSAGAWGFSS